MVARTAAEASAFESWSGVERLDAVQALAKEPMLTGDIMGALWAPDDALLAALIRKLFTDRQLAVPDAVVMRILRSVERSPAAVRD